MRMISAVRNGPENPFFIPNAATTARTWNRLRRINNPAGSRAQPSRRVGVGVEQAQLLTGIREIGIPSGCFEAVHYSRIALYPR